jgi:hypothetical protein
MMKCHLLCQSSILTIHLVIPQELDSKYENGFVIINIPFLAISEFGDGVSSTNQGKL